METQTQRLMPAKAVKSELLDEYRYEYADGFQVVVDRSIQYPEQIKVAVRNPDGLRISEMLVWAREAKKE